MRVRSLSLAIVLAAAVPALASAQVPMRKQGLWEMTMKSTAPAPMSMTMRQCTDPAKEKAGAAFSNGGPTGAAGVDCKAGPVVPALGGGWSYSSVCTMRNMTMTTSGTARGDFAGGYHIDSVTRMSPAPMPQMAETHMSIDAKYLGPCPAGMKPGETQMNGRSIGRPAG